MGNIAPASKYKLSRANYDLFDALPAELRAFLRDQPFNWAAKQVYIIWRTKGIVQAKTWLEKQSQRRIEKEAWLVWGRGDPPRVKNNVLTLADLDL